MYAEAKESFPYNRIGGAEIPPRKIFLNYSNYCLISTVAFLCFLVMNFTSSEKINSWLNFTSSESQGTATNSDFTFKRSGYESLSFMTKNSSTSSILTYAFLSSYVAIIEPYAEMEISPFSLDDSISYTFSMCAYNKTTSTVSSSDCAEGSYQTSTSLPIVISCDPYDEYYLTITKFSSGSQIEQSVGLGICLYVRRDIKTLTTADLASTLDAMHTLWTVSEEEGQELYGSNYHSIDWFTEAHMFNAAQRDSDHIHEGLGFLPQHVKITNIFELAVQAVNPAVALPYWDYTYDEGALSDSYMFKTGTFGSIKFPTSSVYWSYSNDSLLDSAIPDGRWAQATASKNTKYTDLTNAFGYLRGPWNTNPSPYISRFSIISEKTIMYESLPTCESYYHMIQLTDLKDFLDLAPFIPHASTHADIGGVFGCDVLDQLLTSNLILDESSKRKICKKWSTVLKELYRADLISPQSDCETDGDYSRTGVSCGYTCDSSKQSAMVGAMKGLIGTEYVPSDITGAQWDEWRDFVCEGEAYKIFSGDHLEAASPSDPSFWPIHPNLERLLHAKLMAGGFESAVWPTDAADVCDKYSCYEEAFGDKGSYSQCCKGHYEHDQLLDFVSGNISRGYGDSNANIMSYTDPTNVGYAMTYVYDDFSWSHCDESFEAMYTTLLKGAA